MKLLGSQGKKGILVINNVVFFPLSHHAWWHKESHQVGLISLLLWTRVEWMQVCYPRMCWHEQPRTTLTPAPYLILLHQLHHGVPHEQDIRLFVFAVQDKSVVLVWRRKNNQKLAFFLVRFLGLHRTVVQPVTLLLNILFGLSLKLIPLNLLLTPGPFWKPEQKNAFMFF